MLYKKEFAITPYGGAFLKNPEYILISLQKLYMSLLYTISGTIAIKIFCFMNEFCTYDRSRYGIYTLVPYNAECIKGRYGIVQADEFSGNA